MNKVLLSIVIISMILLIPLQSVFSANATNINEEKNKSAGIFHKNYFFCKIRTSDPIDGRAILIPGFSFFPMGGVNVKRAFGILIAFEHFGGSIYFNNDEYSSNFKYAFILWFNGYFKNYWYKTWKIFDIDGIAVFARVCHFF